MRLTERHRELEELTARADEARAGRGGVVVVCGESGAGKTSFVETFLEEWPGDERVLWGVCDPLATPRPLGPIHDLAEQFESGTRKVVRDSNYPYEIHSAVFDELVAQPSVLFIDDLHWADQATVDLLRFVLRRIRRTHSLAVVGLFRPSRLPWYMVCIDVMPHCCRCREDPPRPALARIDRCARTSSLDHSRQPCRIDLATNRGAAPRW